MYTGFYVENGHVYGPTGYTKFYSRDEHIYGPEKKLPWQS
jgi:hypothetical protein